MKVVGISGAPSNAWKCPSEVLLEKSLEELKTAFNAETELIRLKDYKIKLCQGCGVCMQGLPCPTYNNPKDELKVLTEKTYGADGFIFASPVHHTTGILFNWTNFWNRWRLVFEKEHAAHWGVQVNDLEENPLCFSPVASIVTFKERGEGKGLFDIAGRYTAGYRFSDAISLGIKLKDGNGTDPYELLWEEDLEAAVAVGRRMGEILSSELCEMLLQIICGEDMVQ